MTREGARLHARSRPNYIEAEAVQRAILWSEITSGQLYVMHMSTAESSELVKSAQLRGVPVVAETCPPYLVLDDSVFDEDVGHFFASCPQIKTRTDSLRLWKGMRSGEVAVVSSDSRSFLRKQKDAWEGDFTRIPMGLPGVETLLPVLYTHGVRFGRISLEELVRLLASNPAQIMGLYPRKGAIQVGADADLAIIHPTREIIVEPSMLETNADWSPYAGWSLAGFARTTLSRGEIIVEDYRVVGPSGRGRWMPRRRAGLFGRELAPHESP
jgi:dihydropyrimidinase